MEGCACLFCDDKGMVRSAAADDVAVHVFGLLELHALALPKCCRMTSSGEMPLRGTQTNPRVRVYDRIPLSRVNCAREDSNLHGFTHKHLKLARLPFRHERVFAKRDIAAAGAAVQEETWLNHGTPLSPGRCCPMSLRQMV